MTSLLKHAYYAGHVAALSKLGTEAGPIAYSPRDGADHNPVSENNLQQILLEMNREPAVTGDESGIGMPSPSKTGSLNDGGYAASGTGIYSTGGTDLDRSDRDYRKRNNIERAFATNEAIDTSYGPEPAMTQPHGSKYANSLTGGLKNPLTSGNSSMRLSNSLTPKSNNSLNPMSNANRPNFTNQGTQEFRDGQLDNVLTNTISTPAMRAMGNPVP
jgi:hypothetical protein